MLYIITEDLCKRYILRRRREDSALREKTAVQALDKVSFTVERGELIGCIGPNGAGKSTMVKILSGILKPDGGTVLVDGRTPWQTRKEHVRNIGVVFGQRMQLWWDVPIADSYALLRKIYRVPQDRWKTRLDELCEALELGPLLRTPLRQLSLGQRMRAEVCGSLLHSPSLLFLDEPTIGLDAVSKLALRDFLKKENRDRGTTVLLTTHDMEDIAALCSRVMVLGHGKKLYDGALEALLRRYDITRRVRVRYQDGEAAPVLPDGCAMERQNGGWEITYRPEAFPTAGMLTRLQEAGEIAEMTIEPENVDLLIAEMYRELQL